jgi:hypothetical protein
VQIYNKIRTNRNSNKKSKGKNDFYLYFYVQKLYKISKTLRHSDNTKELLRPYKLKGEIIYSAFTKQNRALARLCSSTRALCALCIEHGETNAHNNVEQHSLSCNVMHFYVFSTNRTKNLLVKINVYSFLYIQIKKDLRRNST